MQTCKRTGTTMTAKLTGKLIDEIKGMLENHGVNQYVLALRDPDSADDIVFFQGSAFWRIGVGVDLVENGKTDIKGGKQ